MLKFAANLTMLFTEMPLLNRFEAAGKAGFKYVEVLFPYDFNCHDIYSRLEQHRMELVLFDLPPGNWAGGDRGFANDPRRVDEFKQSVKTGVEWALELNTHRLNCLAGRTLKEYSHEEQWNLLVDNLKYAADYLGQNNLMLLIEPINDFDMPGYFLNNLEKAIKLLDEINMSNVFLQFDVYHIQRIHGEITRLLQQNIKNIGHIQIADNPGRHEPGTGEINYKFVLDQIDKLAYPGFVSLEYIPQIETNQSLNWLKDNGFM